MQASKIKIGETYAYKRGSDLVRFNVSAVVTRRKSNHNNPHDYESTVEGIIQAPDADNNGKASEVFSVLPDQLLGPYQEHLALVEREKAEKAERDAKEADRQDKLVRLVATLYAVSGVARPDANDNGRVRRYDAPITASYSSVNINAEAVEPLLRVLENLVKRDITAEGEIA